MKSILFIAATILILSFNASAQEKNTSKPLPEKYKPQYDTTPKSDFERSKPSVRNGELINHPSPPEKKTIIQHIEKGTIPTKDNTKPSSPDWESKDKTQSIDTKLPPGVEYKKNSPESTLALSELLP